MMSNIRLRPLRFNEFLSKHRHLLYYKSLIKCITIIKMKLVFILKSLWSTIHYIFPSLAITFSNNNYICIKGACIIITSYQRRHSKMSEVIYLIGAGASYGQRGKNRNGEILPGYIERGLPV